MQKLTILAGLTLVLFSFSPAAAGLGGFEGLKIGGGFLWNNERDDPLDTTGGGLHVSGDFSIGGPIRISPFYEFSRRNGITSSIYGGDLHYDMPMSGRTHVYFGPGFGIADTMNKTEFHINAGAGVAYDLRSWFGLFAQVKYAWASDDVINGITAHAGITLPWK